MDVRRIYGNTAVSSEIIVPAPVFATDIGENKISKFSSAVGPTSLVSKKDEDVNYQNLYFQEDLTLTGKLLGYSFDKKIENVWVMDAQTMKIAGKTKTDTEGNYAVAKLDSRREYFVMVERNGKKKTVPAVNYTGYGTLAGVYRITGSIVEGVSVRVFSEESNEFLGEVFTDSTGQFTVPNVSDSHSFYLVFREPSGAWEDRVSSRRFPEL